MRAHRIVALLIATGAMMVAGASAALLNPGVAAAAPGYGNAGNASDAGGAYPAPQPSLTASASSVQTGRQVKVSGSGFRKGEPVTITVRYRIFLGSATFVPPFGSSGHDRANNQGKVMARVPLNYPGYAKITVKGLKSGKRASVTVRVLAWRGPWGNWGAFGGAFGGNFPFGPMFRESGFTTGAAGASAETVQLRLAGATESLPAKPGAAGAELLAGMLGLTGLLGSAMLALRRRRV
jgi:hypothetical protein